MKAFVEGKQLVKTSFGPEEGEGTITAIRQKKLDQQKIIKDMLEVQMCEKTDTRQFNKDMDIMKDDEDQNENKNMLAFNRDIDKGQRQRAKNHWDTELQ